MITLLTAMRSGRPEHTAEPTEVLVDTERASVIVLRFEDGECVEIDRSELLTAAGVPREAAA